MRWEVYNEKNDYLGPIHAEDEAEALSKAKSFGMPTADHVVRADEQVGKGAL